MTKNDARKSSLICKNKPKLSNINLKFNQQKGVTYLWVLLILFIIGLGIGKSLDVYSLRVQRQKEKELISIGLTYQTAIQDYYQSAPSGQPTQYPSDLKQLLKDPRHIVIRRYIRQLYLDPITNKPFEPIVAPQGGIWGVKSASLKPPIHALKLAWFCANKAINTYQDCWFMANVGVK